MTLLTSGPLSITMISGELGANLNVPGIGSYKKLHEASNLPPALYTNDTVEFSLFYGYTHPEISVSLFDVFSTGSNWQYTWRFTRNSAYSDLIVNWDEVVSNGAPTSSSSTFLGTNTTVDLVRTYPYPADVNSEYYVSITVAPREIYDIPAYKGVSSSVSDRVEVPGGNAPASSRRDFRYINFGKNKYQGHNTACDALNAVSLEGPIDIYVPGAGYGTTPPPTGTILYTSPTLLTAYILPTPTSDKWYSVTGGNSVAWKINNGRFRGESICSGGIF
jgi:hypothetical protein